MGSSNLEQNFKLLRYLEGSRKQLKESFSLSKAGTNASDAMFPQVISTGPTFPRNISSWLSVTIRKALGMWIHLCFIYQKLFPFVIQWLSSSQPWWWEGHTVKILKSICIISSPQHSGQHCISSSALLGRTKSQGMSPCPPRLACGGQQGGPGHALWRHSGKCENEFMELSRTCTLEAQ